MGVEPPLRFSKRGGLDRISNIRGGLLGKRGFSTTNLVTFKRWDGVKDEKFEYYGGLLKNLIFRVGVNKKNNL